MEAVRFARLLKPDPHTHNTRTCIYTHNTGERPPGGTTARVSMGDERCAAYVLGSGCPTRATFATDVQRALDAGNNSARHRQFRCTDGDTLFFVKRSCNGAAAHFRHAPTGAPACAPGAIAESRVACGCSKTHIDAQALIQRHVSRLRVRTWRVCGKHPAGIWRADDGARVSLEQSAVFSGRRVRYDVAVHEAGRLAKVIEVRGLPAHL